MADNLLSVLGSESTTQEIIKIINDNSKNIVSKTTKIMGLMTLRNYIVKPVKLFNHLAILNWYTAGTLLYKTVSLDITDKTTIDYFLAWKFVPYSAVQDINGWPFYVEKLTDQMIIHYNRLNHADYFDQLYQAAVREYEKYILRTTYWVFSKKIITGVAVERYITQPYHAVFPSTNYLQVQTILENYVQTNQLTQQYNPAVLLINSDSDYDQTNMGQFLAMAKIFYNIYKIDMRKFLNLTPAEIFWQSFSNILIDETTLFIFNDLDKYWYNLEQQEQGEELQEQQKIEFQNLLLTVIERNNQTKPLAIIFCATNWDMLDAAWKSRCISINWGRCDREEVCNYLRFYNEKYKDTKYHEPQLETHLLRLPELEISFRELTHLGIQNGNNMIKIINALIKYTSCTVASKNNLTINYTKVKVKTKEKEEHEYPDEYKDGFIISGQKCVEPLCPNRTKDDFRGEYYYCPDHQPQYVCRMCKIASSETLLCGDCYFEYEFINCAACHKSFQEESHCQKICSECSEVASACCHRFCLKIITDDIRDKLDTKVGTCVKHTVKCCKCDDYCAEGNIYKIQNEAKKSICLSCFEELSKLYESCHYCCKVTTDQKMDNFKCFKCFNNISLKSIKDAPVCVTCKKILNGLYDKYCSDCRPKEQCLKCYLGLELNQFGYCKQCYKCKNCHSELHFSILQLDHICVNYRQCYDFICHKGHYNNAYVMVQGEKRCKICHNPSYILTNGEFYRFTCRYCGQVDINNKPCQCANCQDENKNLLLSNNLDVKICCHNCSQMKINGLEPVYNKVYISLSRSEIEKINAALNPLFNQQSQPKVFVSGGDIATFYNMINDDKIIYAMIRSNYGKYYLVHFKQLVDMSHNNKRTLFEHRQIISEIWSKITRHQN